MSAGLLAGLLGGGVDVASPEGQWWSVTVTADVAVAAAAADPSSRWWMDRDGVYFPTAGVWVSASTQGQRGDVAVPDGAGVLLARPAVPVAWTALHGALFRGQIGVLATDAADVPVAFGSCTLAEMDQAAEGHYWSPLAQVFFFGLLYAQGAGADVDAAIPEGGGFSFTTALETLLTLEANWRAGWCLGLWELPCVLVKQLGIPSSRIVD